MLLMKNPQFFSESAETLAILPIHEVVVFTKFHENWAKIVDFSLIVNFKASLIFFSSVFTYKYNSTVLLRQLFKCITFSIAELVRRNIPTTFLTKLARIRSNQCWHPAIWSVDNVLLETPNVHHWKQHYC